MRCKFTNPIASWQKDGLHRQGSLDGLCAVYALVNAVWLMCNTVDRDALFAYIIQSIGPKLAAFLLNGLQANDFEAWVLAPAAEFFAEQGAFLHYQIVGGGRLDVFWDRMQQHCWQHGPGSIILGLSGTYEHWTCVQWVSNRCLTLADSGTLQRIYRARATIGRMTKQRLHVLTANETYLLILT